MKWYNIILLILLSIIVVFFYFYGKILYKSFVGINKLVKSESFQSLIKSEGFQNMVKNKDYKNTEAFQNIIKEGFTSACSTCHKEGFQVNIDDLKNVDLSGAITNLADLTNIDLTNVDTSQINATTIIQDINNTNNVATAKPDINDPQTQCTIFKNQINTFNDLREKYRDVGDWGNVRAVNGSISELQEKLSELGCSD